MSLTTQSGCTKPRALSETPSWFGVDTPLGLVQFPKKGRSSSFYDYEGDFSISWHYDDSERRRYANPDEYKIFVKVFEAYQAAPHPNRNCSWSELNPRHEKGFPEFRVPTLFRFFRVSEKGEIRFRSRYDYVELFSLRSASTMRRYTPRRFPLDYRPHNLIECPIAQLNLRTGKSLKYRATWIRRFCASATILEINALQKIINAFIKSYETPRHVPLKKIAESFFSVEEKGMLHLKPLDELSYYINGSDKEWQFKQKFPWGRIVPTIPASTPTYPKQRVKVKPRRFFEKCRPAVPKGNGEEDYDMWSTYFTIQSEGRCIDYTINILLHFSISTSDAIQNQLKRYFPYTFATTLPDDSLWRRTIKKTSEGRERVEITLLPPPPVQATAKNRRLELLAPFEINPVYGNFILQGTEDDFDIWEGIVWNANWPSPDYGFNRYKHSNDYRIKIYVPVGLDNLELREYLRNHMQLAAQELTQFKKAKTRIYGTLVFKPPYNELITPKSSLPRGNTSMECGNSSMEFWTGYRDFEKITFHRKKGDDKWTATIPYRDMQSYPLTVQIDPKAPYEELRSILRSELYKALDLIAQRPPSGTVLLTE